MSRIAKLLEYLPGRQNELLRQKTLQNAYKQCFTGPNGELVLAHLIEKSALANTAPEGAQTNDLMILQGRRDMVLGILRMIHKEPRAMINEITKEYE